MKRRDFLRTSLAGGAAWLGAGGGSWAAEDDSSDLDFKIERHVPTRLFDGKQCWCHPRAGIVPDAGRGGLPRVVMTMNTLDVSGSDVFKAMLHLRTDDLGRTWTEPRESAELAIRHETIDGARRPVAVSDFWPTWHRASKKLLGTGHTVVYTPDWKVLRPRPRHGFSRSTTNTVATAASGWPESAGTARTVCSRRSLESEKRPLALQYSVWRFSIPCP